MAPHSIEECPFERIETAHDSRLKGFSWMFHLSESGQFTGFCYGPGTSIRRRKDPPPYQDAFFIECRNFCKTRTGSIAAIIPKQIAEGFHTDGVELIVVQDIAVAKSDIVLLYYKVKVDCKIDVSNTSETPFTFIQHMIGKNPLLHNSNLKEINLVFLNKIFGPMNRILDRNDIPLERRIGRFPILGVECLKSPDVWFNKYYQNSRFRNFEILRLDGNLIPQAGCSIIKKRSRASKGPSLNPPVYSRIANEPSRVLVCKKIPIDNYKDKVLVPLVKEGFDYLAECEASFALLSKDSLEVVMNVYKEKKELTFAEHNSLLKENSDEIVKLFIFDCGSQPTSVSIVPSLDDVQGSSINECIKELRTTLRYGDFSIPVGNAIFRGYQWPYKTFRLKKRFIQALEAGYGGGKGLVRNVNQHGGGFHMVGQRRSSQSSGTTVCRPGNTVHHDYYTQSHNPIVLHASRSLMNNLQEEALNAGWNSGDPWMPLMSSMFKSERRVDICEHMLFTMKNFWTSVHVDCGDCILDSNMDEMFGRLENSENQMHQSFVKRWKEMFGNQLSMSTTCCWSVMNPLFRFIHIQYFAILLANVAYNLSSPILEKLDQVGGTFSGFMFPHATTVGIWIHTGRETVTMIDPGNFYNFAWGSNGKNRNRRNNNNNAAGGGGNNGGGCIIS